MREINFEFVYRLRAGRANDFLANSKDYENGCGYRNWAGSYANIFYKHLLRIFISLIFGKQPFKWDILQTLLFEGVVEQLIDEITKQGL